MKKLVPPLIAGPYAPPSCKVGRTLACKIRDDVPVDGISDAPIQWPYTRYRGAGVFVSPTPMLIVCGDLERAIKTESSAAVAYHWGVSRAMVRVWRRALGVGRCTEGTTRLLRDHARFKLTSMTPRKLALIREGIAAGQSNRELEAKLGVHWRTVWRIRTGATFAE